MSPNVGNFVHDLVEMAKATEQLPIVIAENEQLKAQHIADGDRIARLESKLIDRNSEIEELHSRIRSLEVERDDYGFRALAADDKANNLQLVLKGMGNSITAALLALEPEPVPTPAAPETPVAASSETPTGDIVGETTRESTSSTAETGSGEQSHSGQSEPGPTAPSSDTPVSPPQSVETSSASPPEPANGPSTPSDRPWAGKLYARVAGFVSRSDWVAGGGTDEAYYWREGDPLPEGVAA